MRQNTHEQKNKTLFLICPIYTVNAQHQSSYYLNIHVRLCNTSQASPPDERHHQPQHLFHLQNDKNLTNKSKISNYAKYEKCFDATSEPISSKVSKTRGFPSGSDVVQTGSIKKTAAASDLEGIDDRDVRARPGSCQTDQSNKSLMLNPQNLFPISFKYNTFSDI